VPGLKLNEMPESRANSFCCGGGGGRIWMETPRQERFSDVRLRQAMDVGAEVLVTSCPYCISNFEGSRETLDVVEKIEVKEADVLIMDSTYPSPNIVFEDKNEVITSIQRYATMKQDRGIVLFGAPIIGRAQELVRILNEAGITPVVDEKIRKANAVYERHGVGMSYRYADLLGSQLEKNENFVAVVEQSKLDQLKAKLSSECSRRIFTAVATGLAKSFTFGTDVQFALSDHADFPQAMDYIGACCPKLIFTIGPRAKVFAKNLSVKGYDARPLEDISKIEGILTNHYR